MNNKLPYRKHPTHGIRFIDGQPTVIYDTVCAKDRQPWLTDGEVHDLLCEVWREANAWLMGRYVIMPDHVHFFAWATNIEIDYENWITYWKSQFSKKHNHRDHRWQTDHWDRRMRSANAYEEKWEYIRRNPVRHNLVDDPDEWPYQGEIHQLRWQ